MKVKFLLLESILLTAFFMLSSNVFSQMCDSIVTFTTTQVTQEELNNLLANEGVNGTLTGTYAYKVVINGGGGYYTHTDMMTCFGGVTPIAGYAKGESDDGDLYRTQIGTDPTMQNLFQFNNLGWVDVTDYIGSDELFYILDSKWGTNIDTWIYFWFATNQPIDEFGYGLLDEYNDDFGSITVEEYEVSGNQQTCDETVTFTTTQVTQDELNDLLVNAGINGTLTGTYAYKVVINGGGGYYTHTDMMTCFGGVTPIAGYAKGESDDGDLYRTQIGTDPTMQNLFQFNNLGWVDVTDYIGSDELFYILDSKWGTNIDTWIYFWFATNQPIDEFGYGLLDEYNDDFGSITVEEYTVTTSGLNDYSNKTLCKLFPNPASNFLNIRSKISCEFRITIFDVYGQNVYSTTLQNDNLINISFLKTGFYFVEITDENDNILLVEKIIKE